MRLDAKVRCIAARLSCCSEDQVDVIDLLLTEMVLAQDSRPEPPLLDLVGPYPADELRYRHGWNDAMRSESPQAMLWRGRLILAARGE